MTGGAGVSASFDEHEQQRGQDRSHRGLAEQAPDRRRRSPERGRETSAGGG